ncbi:MAG: flagellar protein FlgN [Rugosibacter sp.]|nr:flagellar protein FlgN [Rugosibacter sp.]
MALIPIHALLEQTVAELQRFLAMIATERQALVSGDINQLSGIVEEKSALATRLASLEAQRENALHEAGFATGSEGVDGWLAANATTFALPATTAIPMVWQQLITLAAEAKRENEINGKLIGARMQQNQQALGLLLGESADTTTYDAGGQQKSTAGRRPLGSA